MNLFRIFARPSSAPVARERLQILLAHERKSRSSANLVALLHREILAAIGKHVAVDADKVEVKLHQRDAVSMLEIDIEIEPDVWSEAAAAPASSSLAA